MDRKEEESSVNVTVLATDQLATYDTKLYQLPKDFIIGYGVSFHLTTDGKIQPQFYNEQDYLKAGINLVSAMIKKNHCSGFFTIIADTLAAQSTCLSDQEFEENLPRYEQAGQQYLRMNKKYFSIINLPSELKNHTTWNDWRQNKCATTFNKLKNRKNSRERVHSAPMYENSPRISPPYNQRHSYHGTTTSSSQFFNENPTSDFLLEDPKASTFDEFKNILDDTKLLATSKALHSLPTDFNFALRYIEYMHQNSDCPWHDYFVQYVREVVGQRLAVVVKKKHDKKSEDQTSSQTKKEPNMSDDDATKIRHFLFHECAQHLCVGIIARKINTPIRILYKGGLNKAIGFIQKDLIGQMPNSANLYLDVIDFQIFPKANSLTEFQKNSSLLDTSSILGETSPTKPTKSSSPLDESTALRYPVDNVTEKTALISRRNSPPSSPKDVAPAELLLDLTIYLKSPQTARAIVEKFLTALNQIITDKLRQGDPSSSDDGDQTKITYQYSSSKPNTDELISTSMKYFEDPNTTIHALTNFRDSIQHQLYRNATQKTPSPTSTSPVDTKEDLKIGKKGLNQSN